MLTVFGFISRKACDSSIFDICKKKPILMGKSKKGWLMSTTKIWPKQISYRFFFCHFCWLEVAFGVYFWVFGNLLFGLAAFVLCVLSGQVSAFGVGGCVEVFGCLVYPDFENFLLEV